MNNYQNIKSILIPELLTVNNQIKSSEDAIPGLEEAR